ncbi:calcium-binding protein, partial [Nonomuraea sp. NN258]
APNTPAPTDAPAPAPGKATGATIRTGSDGKPMTPRTVKLLPGGSGRDHVSGGAGVDVLYGQAGDDALSGGGHDDYAEGGPGKDVLRGDLPLTADSPHSEVEPIADPGWKGGPSGRAELEGEAPPGQDDLIGGSSTPGAPDAGDVLEGGDAADVLLGDNGSLVRTVTSTGDRVYAERGNGTRSRTHDPDLPGTSTRFCTTAQAACEPADASGADQLHGEDGDDGLWGQDGDDRLRGGDGNDDLFGELGADRMDGGDGEDAMLGDRGGLVNERLDAADAQRLGFTVSLNAPPKESYTGFTAGTYDRRADLLHDADGDTWATSALPHDGFSAGGDDVMRGGHGRDSLHGGYGDDLVNGDSGGDELFGGDGADLLWGGKGCDPVKDAATPDCLSGGAVNPAARGTGDRFVDHVFGGAGADLLDYNPRGSYPDDCAPGRMPDGTPTTVVDPCVWFEMTGKDDGQAADDQHHQGVDWQYGGQGRDVLQGDRTANGPNPGDKMIDWNGSYNLYTHCGPANGGHNIVRQHSPAMLGFLAKVAWGAGAGRTAADATTPGTSAYRELAISSDSGSAFPTTPGHFDSPVACAG